MRRHAIALLVGLSLVACGLSLEGTMTTATDGGAPPPPGTPPPPADAGGSSDASLVPDGPDACGACNITAPPGWTVVAFGSQANACAASLAPLDVVESPVAGGGACTCSAGSCTIQTTPSCTTGSVGTTYDSTSSATCGSTGVDLSLNNGVCRTYSGTFGNHTGIDAPSPSGSGTCTAPAVATLSAVTSTTSRVCTGSSCADLCGGSAGFTACIMANGDQACPASAPTKHLVGSAPTLTCGNCSTCNVTGTTCDGTMTFYSDTACNTVVKAFPANVCTSAGGASYSSYKWVGMAKNAACAPSGPPAPQVGLANVATVCCK